MADKVSVYDMDTQSLVAFVLKSTLRAGMVQGRFQGLEGLVGLEMQYFWGALLARIEKKDPPFREGAVLRQKSYHPQ